MSYLNPVLFSRGINDTHGEAVLAVFSDRYGKSLGQGHEEDQHIPTSYSIYGQANTEGTR